MAKKTPTKTSKKRRFKRNQKVIKDAGKSAGWHFDTYVVNQFSKLKHIRRPVLTWLLLIAVLTIAVFIQTRQLRAYYIDEVPISGGVLKEGMVGQVTNINPLFNANSADASLSKLIFSSLLTYDGQGNLKGDLARKWDVNSNGTKYVFTIRDTAVWHDGQPLTADDIVFTFDMLSHPDTNSPLAAAWRGVKVTKKDDYKVEFSLPNAFAPFPHNLVGLGILPKHILEDVEPDQLRGHRFNLAEPIGSGPFRLIESLVLNDENTGSGIVRFRLIAHPDYHFGKPKLDSLMLFTYSDREEMIADFNSGELALIGGLVASDIPERDSLEPLDEATAGLETKETEGVTLETKSADTRSIPRDSQVMLFLNNNYWLFKNRDVRRGIAYALDRQAIVGLSDGLYTGSKGPLLSSQLGFDSSTSQPARDLKKAAASFKKAGWLIGDDGYRHKNDKTMTITIVTQADDILPETLAMIQKNLKEAGIKVKAKIVGSETIQQDYIAEHAYQALLFGINVGRDPDQFAFWHSSQNGLNGRNLSQYDSSVADAALESGRTRIDKKLRIAKYETFEKQWVSDAPAVALYQPSYIFTHKKQVNGLRLDTISTEADRYHNVHKWTVNVGESEKLY